MPISSVDNIPLILNKVRRLNKVKQFKSILDVGIGFGRYGMLLRECLDIRFNRYNKEEWQTIIHGIDVYTNYINPIHKYIYDDITIGNIIQLSIGLYDIILLIDVLEHMKEEQGSRVIKKLNENSTQLFICSFPTKLVEGANSEWANPAEQHLSLWTEKKLSNLIGPVEALSETLFIKVK